MRQNKKENKNKRKNEEWLRKARHASSVKDIAHVIETMQFHRIFGLVDEQEVWDKLLILDEMYRRVFFIQEEKFRMQLKEKHGAEYTIKPGRQYGRGNPAKKAANDTSEASWQ